MEKDGKYSYCCFHCVPCAADSTGVGKLHACHHMAQPAHLLAAYLLAAHLLAAHFLAVHLLAAHLLAAYLFILITGTFFPSLISHPFSNIVTISS